MIIEATIKDDFMLIYGKLNTTEKINYAKIAKDAMKKDKKIIWLWLK